MAVPKKRSTSSRRNRRRSHHALARVALISCSHCGNKIRPHTVCENCGYYRGKHQVVDVLKKLSKRERKEKEKELEAQQEEATVNSPTGALDAEQLSRKS